MDLVPRTDLTDEEAQQTCKTLFTLLARDAATEDKLEALEAQAAKYRKSRQELQRGIYYYRAIIAPVRLLPVEILGYIFGYLVGSAPDAVFQASRVCRIWRNATMFSHLWANIVVTSETPGALQRARLFLERSGQVPLGVTFVQSELPQWHWSAWSAVKSSALRWSSLSLTLEDCWVASREIRSLPAGRGLTELSVTIRGRCADPAHEGKFGFEPDEQNRVRKDSLAGSQHIKNLHLSTFIIPSPGPLFMGLTKLSIADSFAALEDPGQDISPIQGTDIIGVLIICHNLEEFAFDAEATVPWFIQHAVDNSVEQNRLIKLPRLRSFHFNGHYSCGAYVISRLDAPNLDSAVLRMRPRRTTSTSDVTEHATFSFLKTCQKLRTLHVLAYRGAAMIATLVVGLPRLESLHMEHSPDPDDFVRALGMRGCDLKTWLAPNLSTFIIDSEPFLLNETNMHHLLGRYRSHIKCGTPNPLVSLIVNGHDMLKGMSPGNMADFTRNERFGGKSWTTHEVKPSSADSQAMEIGWHNCIRACRDL